MTFYSIIVASICCFSSLQIFQTDVDVLSSILFVKFAFRRHSNWEALSVFISSDVVLKEKCGNAPLV